MLYFFYMTKSERAADMYEHRYRYFFTLIPGWVFPGIGIWFSFTHADTFGLVQRIIWLFACAVVGGISFCSWVYYGYLIMRRSPPNN